MTNEPPNFEEFTDALYAAGWISRNDAQHDNVLNVYEDWMLLLHNANVATEYWRLLAEKKSTSDERQSDL